MVFRVLNHNARTRSIQIRISGTRLFVCARCGGFVIGAIAGGIGVLASGDPFAVPNNLAWSARIAAVIIAVPALVHVARSYMNEDYGTNTARLLTGVCAGLSVTVMVLTWPTTSLRALSALGMMLAMYSCAFLLRRVALRNQPDRVFRSRGGLLRFRRVTLPGIGVDARIALTGRWIRSLGGAAVLGLPWVGSLILVDMRLYRSLGDKKLASLVAHEMAHQHNKDLEHGFIHNVCLALIVAFGGMISSGVLRVVTIMALVSLGAMAWAWRLRAAEISADLGAVKVTGDPHGYAEMLRTLARSLGIDPCRGSVVCPSVAQRCEAVLHDQGSTQQTLARRRRNLTVLLTIISLVAIATQLERP